jgi:hypothetical membrane protein
MKKSNHFFSSPQFVKFCSISSITIWISAIVLGLLIAQLDRAGPGYDLAGFNPFINYISDLGSLRFTPLPIILDFGMMATGLLMIPVSFSLKRVLVGDGTKIGRKILGNITLVTLIIGMIGFFMTGVFSEDTGEMIDKLYPLPNDYPWHDIVADFAFIFFMISGILVASQFVIFRNILDNEIGIKNPKFTRIILMINTWVFTPIFFGFFYSVPYLWALDEPFWSFLPIWQWAPLWEWLLMFSLSGSLFSVTIMHLKSLNRQMKAE